ncbi:MAG TPA: MFS transporter, partial [Candidatus Dormibacteraeota bacterium]
GGRLGDLYGHRRLLVVGLIVFSLCSLLGAVAPDQRVLVLARCMQGAGAALMYPQSLALIKAHFQGPDLRAALAAFGVALGLASVAAQLAGGLLVQADVLGLGWRAVLLVNVPLGIAAAALVLGTVPASRGRRGARIDLAGAGVLAAALFALVLPLTIGRDLGWPVWTWPALGGAAAAGVVFVLHQRRLTGRGLAPLVPLALLRLRPFAVGLLTTLVLYTGQISLFLLLTLYLQRGLGMDPLRTGLTFTPLAVGFFAASVTAPRLSRRSGVPLLSAGSLVLLAGATGLSVLALSGAGDTLWLPRMLVLIAVGVGFGLVIPTLVGVVLAVVPADQEGGAAGVLVTTQQVAGAVGVALSGLLFFGVLTRAPYATAFALALGLQIVVFAATALLARGLREER